MNIKICAWRWRWEKIFDFQFHGQIFTIFNGSGLTSQARSQHFIDVWLEFASPSKMASLTLKSSIDFYVQDASIGEKEMKKYRTFETIFLGKKLGNMFNPQYITTQKRNTACFTSLVFTYELKIQKRWKSNSYLTPLFPIFELPSNVGPKFKEIIIIAWKNIESFLSYCRISI